MWAKRTIVQGIGYARRAARALVVVAALAVAGDASAARCTVTTGGGVLFGVYDPFSTAPTTATTSLQFQCFGKAQVGWIELSRGNTSPTFAWRELRQGLEVLRYNLYLDASCSRIWGDGTDFSEVYFPDATEKNVAQTVQVYGVIPADQDPLAGAYSDAVVVTIQF